MGGIIHVVQLQFKPEIDSDKINEVISGLRALKERCVLPDGKQYIQSVHVGADNSIEGFQNGYTHMAVSRFKSVEDRNYYAKLDPEHVAFGKSLGPIVKGLQVLDIDA